MAAMSVRCPVLGANVTRILDLEGHVCSIICAEHDEQTGVCQLKKAALAGGPLSQLLERVEKHTLQSRSMRCELS